MASEIIHGSPGSYKTSSLLSLYLYDALKENRTIITNIRGFKDIDTLNEKLCNIEKKSFFGLITKQNPFISTSTIILVDHDIDGFKKMALFFHWAPKNAILLIDEVQQVYPSRLKNLSVFDLEHSYDKDHPMTVEQAFDKHRHMGWDVYMSTPHINKVNKEIRQVCENAYRHKNMAGLTGSKGRFKRIQHDPENNGKSLSNQSSSTYHKMNKIYFDFYDSTTTGNAKDIKSENKLFKSPKFILVFVLLFSALSFLLYTLSTTDFTLSPQPQSSPKLPTSDIHPKAPTSHFHDNQAHPDHASRNVSDGTSLQDAVFFDIVESIKYYQGYMYGKMAAGHKHIHLFMSENGEITSKDLTQMGYYITSFSSGILITNGTHFKYVSHGDPEVKISRLSQSQQSSNSPLQPQI